MAGKAIGWKYRAALCTLAVFTALQFWIHSMVPQQHLNDDDIVECLGAASGSQQCFEARLFKQWHVAASVTADAETPAMDAEIEQPGLPVRPHILEALRLVTDIAAQETRQVEPPQEEQTSPVNKTMSNELEAQEPEKSFDIVYDELMKTDVWVAYTNNTVMEPQSAMWAQELIDLQSKLEGRMNKLKILHTANHTWTQKHKIPDKSEAEAHHTHIEAWTRDLDAMQNKLKARGDELIRKRKARQAAKHATESPREEVPEQFSSTTVGLEQQIWDYGKELCSDPRRRNYTSCKHFNERAQAGSGEMESDTKPATTPRPQSMHESEKRMHWRDVKQWRSSDGAKSLRGSSLDELPIAVVSQDEARHAKWGGMLPTVACVAVVPKGKDISHELRYFVDNFNLQNYEGLKQLIIVAHSDDQAARRVLAKHADGIVVKAVFVMDTSRHLATSYRFGAWAATDADIIARWDIDAWHHPSRLSLQIHAMALAKRPVSRLRSWTTRHYSDAGATEAEKNESLGEPSLIGEKEWMNQYWYPMIGEEFLATEQSKHLAELDTSDLIVFQA
jgi:hypothetical protein